MKKIFKNGTFKFIVGAFILFVGIWFYMPWASVWRSVPFVIAAGVFAGMLIDSKKELAGVSFGICFALSLSFGQSIILAALLSAACAFFAFSGAFVYGGIKLICKNKKQDKPAFQGTWCYVLMLFISLGLYVVVCGNVFSAAGHNSANLKYLNENYKNMVSDTYTYYSVPEFAYRTCFCFEYRGIGVDTELVGEDGNCYIQNKGGVITDGIRNRYEEDIVDWCSRYTTSVLGSATDFFKVIDGDVVFNNGEIVEKVNELSEYKKYQSRVNYVVGVYAVEMDKEHFSKVCAKIKKVVDSEKDYSYGNIFVVGVDAKEPKFTCKLTPNADFKETDAVKFEEKTLNKLGVTLDDILAYWR